jgi:hypothetical protein
LLQHGINKYPEFKDDKKPQVLRALKTPNITFVGFENGSLVVDFDPVLH